MTDQELTDLVRAKTPSELTIPQVRELQTRLAESARMRDALQPEVKNGYLETALARVDVSLATLLEDANRKERTAAFVPLLGLIVGAACIAFFAMVVYSGLTRDEEPTQENEKLVAKQDESSDPKSPSSPEDEPPGPETRVEETTPSGEVAVDDNPKQNDPKTVTPEQPKPEIVELEEPIPAGPWLENLTAPVEDYDATRFTEFDYKAGTPQPDDLKEWFAKTPGYDGEYREMHTNINHRSRKVGGVDGLMAIRAPFREESVLRLSLKPHLTSSPLLFHFFHEEEGITLAYYENFNYLWAAYKTQRQPGEPKPDRYTLATTDNYRMQRTELRMGGQFEIRHCRDELLVIRGDVVVLRAPLVGPIDDAFIEGKAAFHGLDMKRISPPPPKPPEYPIAEVIKRPADLPWSEPTQETISLEKLATGSLRINAVEGSRGWTTTPLPRHGVQQIVLELNDITPGSGVFLGRGDGHVHTVVRFARDTKNNNRLWATFTGNDDHINESGESPHKKLSPYMNKKAWVKMQFVAGHFRWWTSVDGEYWAEPREPRPWLPGNIETLGLHLVGGEFQRGLTLEKITIHRFPALNTLVIAEIQKQTKPLHNLSGFGAWEIEVNKGQPEGVSKDRWLAASAVATLAAGCDLPLGKELIRRLVATEAYAELGVEEQFDVLDELSMVANVSGDHEQFLELLREYIATAQNAERPFQALRTRVMESPMYVHHPVNERYVPSMKQDLLQSVYSNDPSRTLRLCREIRFYHLEERLPLIEWVESTAARQLPENERGVLLARLKTAWREPLIEDLSKQTYNTLAEFRAMIESGDFADAARQITLLNPDDFDGVAPDDDPRRLVSIPATVTAALQQYPELRETLRKEFGEVANIRVQRAIGSDDTASIQLATWQFEGTPAASIAHRYLGDQSLANGWFEKAQVEYERALVNAPPLARSEIEARLRMAAAMQGKDIGDPVTSPVQFGDTQLSSKEYEAMIADLRKHNQIDDSKQAGSKPVAMLPGKLESEKRSAFEGQFGASPNSEATRFTRQELVDWAGRQFAVVVTPQEVLVSNRFQLNCYRRDNLEQKWRGVKPRGNPMRSQEWMGAPMKPLVVGDRVYARLLYGKGPLLACYELESGRLLWDVEPQRENFPVTDPVMIQGRLLVLTVQRGGQEQSSLRIQEIDPQTGETRTDKLLLRLSESWWTKRVATMHVEDEFMVVALGGVSFRCNAQGAISWIRRQTVTPSEEDPSWVRQHQQPPLVYKQRLYIAQPGVKTIECVNPETGELHWESIIHDIERIIGVSAEHLIVQSKDTVQALRLSDGQPMWRQNIERLRTASRCSEEGPILVFGLQPAEKRSGEYDPLAIWLDPTNGEVVETNTFEKLRSREPRLGPMFNVDDRSFVFAGNEHDRPQRDIVELKK